MRHIALRALDAAGRVFDRLDRTCLYLSAGCSRLADLRHGTTAAWDTFLTDDDSIGSGWMRWEQQAADHAVRPADRILIVGCGSGRDSIPFLERGCHVTGIDPAPAAIAAAHRALAARDLTADLRVGFFEDAFAQPGAGEQFDVVWFSWFAYSYMPDSRRRVAVLRQAVALLAPGGRIVLSLLRRPPESRLVAVAATIGRWTGADWAIARGDVFSRITGSRFLRYEHYFIEGEAEAEIEAAGLDIGATLERGSVLVLTPAST